MVIEQQAAALLGLLRERRPVVHHLANFVTMNDVAAATRAVGALPVMALAQEEIREIVERAAAVAVNLGTPTRERLDAAKLAVQVAREKEIPIIIDPVGAGASRLRTDAAQRVIRLAGNAVVRANPAEAAALAGLPAQIRGVEASGQYDTLAVAVALARSCGIAAVTGPRDIITNGMHVLAVDNGHPWLAALPGAGCMATAVVGAFCAVADATDLIAAVTAGLACFGLAAERAAGRAGGPGTLKPLLMDALFALSPAELQAGARCTELEPIHAAP